MACAMCAVYWEECRNVSHISGAEANPTFGFKQVMIASDLTYPVVTSEHYHTTLASPGLQDVLPCFHYVLQRALPVPAG